MALQRLRLCKKGILGSRSCFLLHVDNQFQLSIRSDLSFLATSTVLYCVRSVQQHESRDLLTPSLVLGLSRAEEAISATIHGDVKFCNAGYGVDANIIMEKGKLTI